MSMTGRGRDDGAVAVMTAVLVVLLLSAAAITVDLGNAWERRRQAQSSADLAALAGAAFLPDETAAFNQALTYVTVHNLVPSGAITSGQLSDGDPSNGEIATTKDEVHVVLPPRTVEFGLASVMGFSSMTVSAEAVATVRSPAAILPVFLPSPCSFGPQTVRDPSNGQSQPTTPTFTPTGTAQGPQPTQLNPATLIQSTGPQTIQVSFKNMNTPPTGISADFTLDSQTRVTTTAIVITSGPTPKGQQDGTMTLTVPTSVTTTPGAWYVRLGQGSPTDWTQDNKALPFTIAPVAGGAECGTSTGDFGQVDSPRGDSTSSGQWLAMNFAKGLDHLVVPYVGSPVNPTQKKNCEWTGHQPIPGGIWDDDPTRDDANCLKTKTGFDMPGATRGLISGTLNGVPGRLTGSPSKSCPGPGGSANRLTSFGGTDISSTTIDCYLSGHTVSELICNPSASSCLSHILDPSIFDDPRFMYVPVITAVTDPQNGYYVIENFRAAFITDETTTSPATTDNGILLGPQGIIELDAITFDRSMLPADASGRGNGYLYSGGTKEVRLIK